MLVKYETGLAKKSIIKTSNNHICIMHIFFRKISTAFLIVLLINTLAAAQDIEEVLRDYDSGRLDRVREALDLLEARYYNAPEYLFLKAVFEQDGERAFALYQQINETDPDNPIFERVLWRMCQYHYAKGLYGACNDMLARFISSFPDSDSVENARRMQQRAAEKLGGDTAPASPQTQPNVKKYVIQIAAFGSRTGAERGLRYYKSLGIDNTRIEEHMVGKQILYKIWIGEFFDRDTARRKAEELLRRYKLSAYTIVEISR